MTWKDIKLATLQKMFSAEGNNIPSDESVRDYLAGMPYVANEGLLMMCTTKKYIIKSVELGILQGTKVGNFLKYKFSELTPDFFEFAGEVYYSDEHVYQRTHNYATEAQDVFVIPSNSQGIYTVYYHAYPEEITASTEDEHILKIPPEVLAILPLYMASQLYKEDDNGIATSFRNEFEVAFGRITQDNLSLKMETENESGW